MLKKLFKRRSFLSDFGVMSFAMASWSARTAPLDEEARPDVKALLAGSAPIVWVFTGDSVTQGGVHTMGWRSYSELFHERVRQELSRVQDTVINTGVNGDTTSGLLKNL
jgi:lysophospholipase L1-like esterase